MTCASYNNKTGWLTLQRKGGSINIITQIINHQLTFYTLTHVYFQLSLVVNYTRCYA